MIATRITSLLALLCCLTLASWINGVSAAEKKHTVDFRLTSWKKIHVEDVKKADVHFKTLKRLGCEVKKDVHNGHVDISYRVVKWRTASFMTHKEAHQWQNYFKGMGFETRHTH